MMRTLLARNQTWLVIFAVLLLGGTIYLAFCKYWAENSASPWRSVNGEMAAMLASVFPASPTPQGAVSPAGTVTLSASPQAASGEIPGLAPAAEAAAAPAVDASPTPAVPSGLIDINTASVSRLTDLPGIGPSKAQAIVDYRGTKGPFRTPEELMKVKGIGTKTYEKLKHLIFVSS